MNRIRLAAAAVNQTPMAWDSNTAHIVAALDAARDAGVHVLCLPELCISGYGCEDMFFSAGIQSTALDVLERLVPETRGLIASFGLPIFFEGAVYNAAALACDGTLLGLVCKQHLAGDGIHYEPRWFRRWPAGVVGQVEIGDREYPIGDLLFDCGGVKIGFEICRDAWVADRTGARLAQRGADILINPSASHFAFAKQQIRERFVLEGSRAFCVSYAYSNLLGNEAGRSIYDGGTLIATNGKMLARGPRFSFADWLLTTAIIDLHATRRAKAESFPESSPRPTSNRADNIVADFTYDDVSEPIGTIQSISGVCSVPRSRNGTAATVFSVPGHPSWEIGVHQKEEEFARSLALALFDYIRKSRSQGCVVSLSGGADSSTVTVLVHLLAQFGGRELGFASLINKLPHIASLAKARMDDRDPTTAGRAIVERLLTCVYQSTRNSGSTTLNAAKTVAAAVGAEFFEWSVDAMVDDYVRTVSQAIGRDLTWQHDDVSLQNVQARARGPGIWLLANIRNALLLTTSNRSEAAVGYATMDGDTCGGLAPIAGIDKAFLLDWLKWMSNTGPAGIGPLVALSAVTCLRPTAELRPSCEDQTDEGDLMPYRVLDAIERAAIRDKLLPIEVLEAVRPQFPDDDRQQLGVWVERFFRLWCRNQWKRERYAPSFHLDDENLDPKSWCRFPILNSGFEKELVELRDYLAKEQR
ncbi:MAG TPA: nitrilase-related carbon-nitrogen hydrolase [Lacipirellulaceae bacterium]|nr:nitrilase-related carbon-nitrogen hydrolase [Lacipirellulaceae bacterium]